MQAAQTEVTETAPEITQEVASKIRQLGTVSVDRITLEPDEIKYLWAVGILNDVAYVALALQIDKRQYKEMKSFDFGVFIERWCFVGEDAPSKFLKSKQIRDAIHKLEAAHFIKVEQQLSLELNY
jgi:hypothetical protein